MLQTIPQEALSRLLSGTHVSGTLKDILSAGTQPVLLVFLRHFGCIFCRELVRDIRKISEATPSFPRTVFFHQGNPIEGAEFFEKYWPTASSISDEERYFYSVFEIENATPFQLLSPAVIACGIRATLKGNMVGKTVGDVWVMPGMFLIKDRDIIWQHDFSHQGDHPDLEDIPYK